MVVMVMFETRVLCKHCPLNERQIYLPYLSSVKLVGWCGRIKQVQIFSNGVLIRSKAHQVPPGSHLGSSLYFDLDLHTTDLTSSNIPYITTKGV